MSISSRKRSWMFLPAPLLCAGLALGCESSSGSQLLPDAASSGAPDAGNADASAADATLDAAAPPDATLTDASPGQAGDEGGATPPDGSGPASDAGMSDVAMADGGGLPARLLVSGAGLVVEGVTSDDQVIYFDNSTKTYFSIPLAGGPTTTIYTAPATDNTAYASVIGKVAFVWSWNSSFIGTLATWSSPMPQGVSLTGNGLAYRYQTMWASEDSKHIVWLTSVSSDASISALYGANADGTGATVLLPNVDTHTYLTGGFARVVFRGDYAIVSCETVSDAGAFSLVIQAFSISNGWAPTALVPNWIHPVQFNFLDRSPFTFPFAVDPAGGRFAAASRDSANGALQIFPLDGGPSVVLDPNVAITPSQSFTGSVGDPWSLFYNDDAGVLRVAPADNPTPQVLVDAGVNYINALSNDGQWLLVSNQTNGGWFADLSLVSATSASSPTVVAASDPDAGLPVAANVAQYGGERGFTANSVYALAMTNLIQNNSGQWIGNLTSMQVAAPHATKSLGVGYTIGYASLGGSKLLVADDFVDTDGGSNPSVDLDIVDPTSDASPISIVRGGAGDNGLSADKTQIAYTLHTGPAPGIYVSPIP